MKKRSKNKFFNIDSEWEKNWVGMPAFDNKLIEPYQSITINFRDEIDVDIFAGIINQNISRETKYLWFPRLNDVDKNQWSIGDRVYMRKKKLNPKYPVYVISKGRWESRLTSRYLEIMRVPYRIVIEPQEFDEYSKVIDEKKILILPFSNLGKGSIPARNWVWDHSIKEGHKKHWILDDNIRGFYRYHKNQKIPFGDGSIFKIAEDFIDRYENVAIAGFHYTMFTPSRQGGDRPPYYLNTRVYSCLLIENKIKHRWRGRYNEDTDLCLRVLKDGWCTILFNAFLIQKIATMTMTGGNTELLYQDDGRLQMAESLRKQHPDIVRTTYKWGRAQHYVDYRKFKKNKLKLKKGVKIKKGTNNFGLYLRDFFKENKRNYVEIKRLSESTQNDFQLLVSEYLDNDDDKYKLKIKRRKKNK